MTEQSFYAFLIAKMKLVITMNTKMTPQSNIVKTQAICLEQFYFK